MSGPITAPPLPPGIGSAPNIVSVLQLAKAKGIVMLIHADSGVGKTSLLRTLPAERTIVYDIDGGVGGLSDPGKPGTPYEGMPPWDGAIVPSMSDLSNLKQFVEWVTTAAHKYTTVVIDSASQMERRMIFLYAGTSEVGIKHYGDAAVASRKYLFALRDLTAKGVNVIFMLHTRTDVKGAEGIKFPALSDKLSREIVGMCDAVGYLALGADQVTRTLQFAPSLGITAKSRFNQIRDFENLDLGDIIGRVLGARRLPAAPPSLPASTTAAPLPVTSTAAPAAPKPENTKGK